MDYKLYKYKLFSSNLILFTSNSTLPNSNYVNAALFIYKFIYVKLFSEVLVQVVINILICFLKSGF